MPETAKTGSESARDTAETHKDDAETAQTAAESARDTASNHRDDAEKLAIHAEDSQFQLTDNTYGYSALHYNAKAQAAKTAAGNSPDSRRNRKQQFPQRCTAPAQATPRPASMQVTCSTAPTQAHC